MAENKKTIEEEQEEQKEQEEEEAPKKKKKKKNNKNKNKKNKEEEEEEQEQEEQEEQEQEEEKEEEGAPEKSLDNFLEKFNELIHNPDKMRVRKDLQNHLKEINKFEAKFPKLSKVTRKESNIEEWCGLKGGQGVFATEKLVTNQQIKFDYSFLNDACTFEDLPLSNGRELVRKFLKKSLEKANVIAEEKTKALVTTIKDIKENEELFKVGYWDHYAGYFLTASHHFSGYNFKELEQVYYSCGALFDHCKRDFEQYKTCVWNWLKGGELPTECEKYRNLPTLLTPTQLYEIAKFVREKQKKQKKNEKKNEKKKNKSLLKKEELTTNPEEESEIEDKLDS